jgi:hypothetical protein
VWGYNIAWGGAGVMRDRSHSQETKDKIGNANRGRVFTEEHRQKLRDNAWDHSGEKHPMFGKHLSEEAKKKIGDNSRGEKNPNYGKPMPEERRLKQSRTKKEKGIAKGVNNPRFGTKLEGTASKYYGVTFKIDKGKYKGWVARIYNNGKRIYLGKHKTEEEAARAYDIYVIEHNLPNPLNFPEDYN